jgi:threonine synthase
MSYALHFECIRCAETYPFEPMFYGCPACFEEKPANVRTIYDYEAIAGAFSKRQLSERPANMWRYHEFLPAETENVVTIDEGFTPLVHCKNLGRKLGMTQLYVKDESRNPTWSFKDRMASATASMAGQYGARVLTAASSGNGGAAAAAYAARADMDAIILTTMQMPSTMRTLMQAYGAKLLATETLAERWTVVNKGVGEYGWFPVQNFNNPSTGANPYAVDGCKTLGYETCEQLDWQLPDVVICPTGSGDTFAGMWYAFQEWQELGLVSGQLPRMVAAEVFGPLENALAKGLDYTEAMPTGPTVGISVGVANSAFQSLRTLWESEGIALRANDEEMLQAQMDLATTEGIYAEASAALALAVAKKLRTRGEIAEDDVVVVLNTSGGLKDPGVTQRMLPEIPVIEPTEEALREALRDVYETELAV